MIIFKTFLRLLRRSIPLILSYSLIFFLISALNASSPATKPASLDPDEPYAIHIHVQDLDQTEASKAFAAYLNSRFIAVSFDGSDQELYEFVTSSGIEAAIRILPDFEEHVSRNEKAVELLRNPLGQSSWQLEPEISKYLRFARASLQDGKIDSQAVTKILSDNSTLHFVGRHQRNEKFQQTWLKIFFRFAGYIILCIVISSFSLCLADFNESKNRARRVVSSFRPWRYHSQIILGLSLLTFFLFLLFSCGSFIFFPHIEDGAAFAHFLLCFALLCFVAMAAGYLVNNLSSKESLNTTIGSMAPLALAFISGTMTGLDYINPSALNVAKLFPLYYYNLVLEGIDFARNAIVLFLFAILYFLLAVIVSRTRSKDQLS